MVSSRFSIPKMLSILSSVVKLNIQVPGHKVCLSGWTSGTTDQVLEASGPLSGCGYTLNFHISPTRAIKVLSLIPTCCISNPSWTFLTYIRSVFFLLRNTCPLVCPSILQPPLKSRAKRLGHCNEPNLLLTLCFHKAGSGNDEWPNMNANCEKTQSQHS